MTGSSRDSSYAFIVSTILAVASLIVAFAAWRFPSVPASEAPVVESAKPHQISGHRPSGTPPASEFKSEESVNSDLPRESSADLKSHSNSGRERDVPESRLDQMLGKVMVLKESAPITLVSLDTVLSVSFRDTLGSKYAEISVFPSGGQAIRFPARRAGASGSFEVADSYYEIQIVSLDWDRGVVSIIIATL